METYNLVDFISYFGSYYPVIIPIAFALLLIASYVLDLFRVWCIKFVDENESGPYKMYVEPFLRRVVIKEPTLGVNEVPYELYNFKNIYFKPNYGAYALKIGDKVLYTDYPSDHRKASEALELCQDSDDLISLYEALKSEVKFKSVTNKRADKKVEKPPLTVLICLYLLAMGFALLSYKIAPSLTIGILVGYCVLRVARSIVRLTKRFNKHISDGHGAKQEQ